MAVVVMLVAAKVQLAWASRARMPGRRKYSLGAEQPPQVIRKAHCRNLVADQGIVLNNVFIPAGSTRAVPISALRPTLTIQFLVTGKPLSGIYNTVPVVATLVPGRSPIVALELTTCGTGGVCGGCASPRDLGLQTASASSFLQGLADGCSERAKNHLGFAWGEVLETTPGKWKSVVNLVGKSLIRVPAGIAFE